MKKIIYTRPDGGLSVVTPAINTYPASENITEEQALSRAMAKLPIEATNVQIVDEAAIPTDRTFRNAWVQSGGKVEHDMDRCCEIHKENLRHLRAPKLAALDVEYQRADEAGDVDAKKAIAAKKQTLRDVTSDPRIAAATTVDQLKAAVPDALK